MGARKRLAAQIVKKDKINIIYSKLNNCSSSPRKMRLICNIIRGKRIDKALFILKYSKQQVSEKLEKLLLSAISNWQQRNKFLNIETENLFIKRIKVDCGTSLKRMRPAPQGRGHRIRKRSNHVTIIIDKENNN